MCDTKNVLVAYYDHACIIHVGHTLCPEVKGGTGMAMTVLQALRAVDDRDGRLCKTCVLS